MVDDLPIEVGLHVLAKPIGPICNLDCAYCYYLEKESLYPGTHTWKMSDDTLEVYVRQYIESQPADTEEIIFGWQGGEPTLLPIDFYREVIRLQKLYTLAGVSCTNTIQTNGVLLDDDWCRFFKDNGFLVGLSIDGPAELHDRYRYDKNGSPTHSLVMRGLTLLQRHEVPFNVLTVVNRHNGSHPRRIYRFLKSHGVRFIQFIPIVEQNTPARTTSSTLPVYRADVETDQLVSERSVRPAQFGRFLIEVFDEWIRGDVGTVFVQIFDQALSAWMGIEPGLCIFRENCGRAPAIEHNGDLYSCDHYVEPDYLLGNIHSAAISELAASDRQRQFGRAKSGTLPMYCRNCDVRFICNGECPKNRFLTTPDGESGLNYLCEGYKSFFRHIDPWMRAMAEELRNERPAANVMKRFQHERVKQSDFNPLHGQQIGRNAPCPCGSGLKYKACCLKFTRRS